MQGVVGMGGMVCGKGCDDITLKYRQFPKQMPNYKTKPEIINITKYRMYASDKPISWPPISSCENHYFSNVGDD